MKKILLLLSLLLPVILKAQYCEVSGYQEGNWNCDTVLVVGEVIVPENASLIVTEGTNVIFEDYYSITVNGSITAIGTESKPINFTAIDTTGFHICNSGQGGWNAVVIKDTKTLSKFDYCHFSYGKAAEDVALGGALRVFNADSIYISNCHFYNNFTRWKGAAMYAENSNLKINNCEVYDNLGYNNEGEYMHGGGFQFLKCNVEMEDMYFHDNYCASCYGGGVNFDSCYVYVNKAVFEDNYAVNAGGMGIQRSNDYNVEVYNCLFNNNIAYHYGGAMAIATSSPKIYNVTMANNYTVAAGGGAMQFYSEAKPVFKNCIIWGNDWYDYNDNPEGRQIFVWGADCTPEFYSSVLEGGRKQIYGDEYVIYDMESMIETEPLFVDTIARDFRLQDNSPAINAGTPDTTDMDLPSTDLIGNQRIIGDRIDMGCYESEVVAVKEIHRNKSQIEIYPNPVSSESKCKFVLKNSSNAVVKVYNPMGSLLLTEGCGMLSAGLNEISLKNIIQSLSENLNVYIISVETDNEIIKTKFVY